MEPVPYDQYVLTKNDNWSQRFDFLDESWYNEVERHVGSTKDNILELVRGKQTYQVGY